MNDLDKQYLSTLEQLVRVLAKVMNENPTSGLLRNLVPSRT